MITFFAKTKALQKFPKNSSVLVQNYSITFVHQLLHNLEVTITLWDSVTPDDANIPRESFSHHPPVSRLVAKFPGGSMPLFGQADLRLNYLPLTIQ